MIMTAFLKGNGGSNSVFEVIPERAIVITHVSAIPGESGFGCSQPFQVEIDGGANGPYTLDIPGQTFLVDSGSITIAVNAGAYLFIFGKGASGCSPFESSPSDIQVAVQYVMQ